MTMAHGRGQPQPFFTASAQNYIQREKTSYLADMVNERCVVIMLNSFWKSSFVGTDTWSQTRRLTVTNARQWDSKTT